jgi:hypothetical protein
MNALAYFLYFEKMKLGLRVCDLHVVGVSVNSSPINFWMPEQDFMKSGMYIMGPELISTA